MTTPAQRKLVKLRLADIRKAKQKRVRWFKWTGFAGKTLWDWLQLLGILAIPLVVVGATIAFGLLQANLAQQQHDADQRQALDQQQATILQTYIDNIQDLLLNHNLLNAKPTNDVAILAKARTQTALQGLDAKRKGTLVQFLYDAKLIGFTDCPTICIDKRKLTPPIISLINTDLSNADLSGDYLYGVDLSGTYLGGTNLSSTLLANANLSGAYLSNTNLSGALLINANLSFLNANLSFLGVPGDFLSQAHYHLDPSNFRSAYLNSADFTEANFNGGDNFAGADLSKANLAYVQVFTQQQLDQVKSCKGATLPNRFICHKTSSP
jgi:uncharacterized protein YjbI with pentapeptide repeats